uniref:Uncharacterized protein n=1 Tax=Urocitellus parryii TaxID=9999 RepID=A0A8D2HPK5_UROPR
ELGVEAESMPPPSSGRFPNQNQTRNCWQNYVDFQGCQKAMTAKGGDISICECLDEALRVWTGP